jgi:hypothetical protein
MSSNEVEIFIKDFEANRPSNCVDAYFSRRMSSKYITYQPSISSNVQAEILDTILPFIKMQITNNELVEYNPVGVADCEIECMQSDRIPLIREFFESIDPGPVYKEMDSLNLEKIGFYCFQISYNNHHLFLFRQFQKLKKLRRGLMMRLFNDELTTMDNNFIGIDDTVDILVFDKSVYIFNHVSLERIFQYKDEFLAKTNEALGEILKQNVISNIEQFAEDCTRDVRITKRFTNIMTKGRLPTFFDNYDKVPEIVQELELDLEFDDEGKLIYREKSQLFHIINLLSDAYFKSLLANRKGIAKTEEEFNI